MDETNKIDRNIRPGDACYGVFIPAFSPAADGSGPSGCTDVCPGKAMSDYSDHPKDVPDEGLPVRYFLPDSLLPGTDAMSDLYEARNWALLRTRAEAVTFRAALADAAVIELKERIRRLSPFLS